MKSKQVLRVLLFAAALVLRCLFISSRGIQYDDAFSILLSQRSPVEIIQGTAGDTMPPLYYLVLHFWMLIAQTIWWYRLLSIVLSFTSLYLFFETMKKIAGETAALWGLLLGVISPFQIYHAQDIRMYALMQFFQIFYYYLFILILKGEQHSRLLWIGILITGTGAFYSHNLAAFFLLVPNIYLVITKRWKMLLKLVLAQIGMLVLFSPWAVLLPAQLNKIQTAFWTPRPGLLEIVQAIVTFLGSLTLPPPLLQIVVVFSCIFFLMIVVFGMINRSISQDLKTLIFISIFWTPLVLFALSFIMRPVFVPRAFLVSSLFFYGLAGVVIAAQLKHSMRFGIVLIIVCLGLLSLPDVYQFDQFPRSPFKTAIGSIQSQIEEREVVVHDNKLSYFPSIIYFPDVPQAFIADAAGTSNDTFALTSQVAMDIYPAPTIDQAVGAHPIVDFVVFARTLKDYEELGYPVHPGINWLQEHMQLEEINQFGDLFVYRFVQ